MVISPFNYNDRFGAHLVDLVENTMLHHVAPRAQACPEKKTKLFFVIFM